MAVHSVDLCQFKSLLFGLLCNMPYRSNEDLPPSVTRHLPPHAQDIYRAAFNHAFAAHVGDPRQEEAAHRIAWAAVKRSYVKVGDSWLTRANHA
jgi:cation transport regulator